MKQKADKSLDRSKPIRIGIFDSGVGGLTVAKAIHRYLPGFPLIYFGDSAHVPYGNKSKENILSYSRDNIQFLIKQGAEVIVIACNTSSAIALDQLRSHFTIPLIGVIDPGVLAVLASLSKLKKPVKGGQTYTGKPGITVAATFRTVDSQIYKKKIQACHAGISVYQVACPLLVPMIEEGMIHTGILDEVLRKYLSSAADRSQVLLLGCTHYPLIKKSFSKVFPHLQVVDSAESVAFFLREMLREGKLLPRKDIDIHPLPLAEVRLPPFRIQQRRTSDKSIKIYTNDSNEVFSTISRKLFPGVKVHRIPWA